MVIKLIYDYLICFPVFLSVLCRLFSWVQQKLLSIGSTGFLHSLSMQSKTQSLENGSISNVPLFLTMKNWDWEEEPMTNETGEIKEA